MWGVWLPESQFQPRQGWKLVSGDFIRQFWWTLIIKHHSSIHISQRAQNTIIRLNTGFVLDYSQAAAHCLFLLQESFTVVTSFKSRRGTLPDTVEEAPQLFEVIAKYVY